MNLSNQSFTQDEFDTWQRYTESHSGLPLQTKLETLQLKRVKIAEAKNFNFNEQAKPHGRRRDKESTPHFGLGHLSVQSLQWP